MKTIRKNIALLHLNPKKELLYYVVFVLAIIGAGIGLYLFQRQIAFLIFPLLGAILFTYYYGSRYSRMLEKQALLNEEEFVRLFTFFQVYLNDGYNIYNALQALLPYASEGVREHLEKLISDIDNDKTVAPFVEFGSHFKDIQIHQVMLSVYQMVDQGTSDVYLRQFQHIFGKLSDQKHELSMSRRIDKVSSLSVLPLIGSGISMIMLLTALVEIMGGVMNGL